MNKDFSKEKLTSFSEEKVFKILYDLSSFIEEKNKDYESNSFQKLKKYHDFLQEHPSAQIQKLNKEFKKVKALDYQFQVYLMNLERLLGQSKKEYQFLVNTQDKESHERTVFSLYCLLDSVRSAHNVGAMFRNSECFGVEKMILCGLTPTPESPQVIKTAMGCHENIPWEYHKEVLPLLQKLKREGFKICSIETSKNAISINSIEKLPAKIVLIFGHEQFGISQEILEQSDLYFNIPLYGIKNSLNVSVCQGIILNSLSYKMEKADTIE